MAENGIDYPNKYVETLNDVEIFREGTWNGRKFTPQDIEDVAETYDTKLLRAPIVFDHFFGGPAKGHILGLKSVDEPGDLGVVKLYASIGLLPAGYDALQNGEWNERSVALSKWYPTDGFYYLWHLSFLGGANPAVPGMNPIILPEDSSQVDESIKNFSSEMIEYMHQSFDQFNQMKAQGANSFSWSQSDTHIEYKIREESRFKDGSLMNDVLDDTKYISAMVGVLQSKYVTQGNDPGALVIQKLSFAREKWNLKKAKRWLSQNRNLLSISGKFDQDAHKIFYLKGDLISLAPDLDERIEAFNYPTIWAVEDRSLDAIFEYDCDTDETSINEFVIDETDNYIRARVRPPTWFKEGSFRTKNLSTKDGIKSVQGKLKPEKVPQGNKPDSMVNQSILFTKSKAWTKEKVQDWIKQHPNLSSIEDALYKLTTGEPVASQIPESGRSVVSMEGNEINASNQGTVVSDQPVKRVIAEDNSEAVMQAKIDQLERDLDATNAENLELKQKYHHDLSIEKETARMSLIKTKMQRLKTDGHILPAQEEFGVYELASMLPEKATIKLRSTGKTISAVDAFFEILKAPGRFELGKIESDFVPLDDETKADTTDRYEANHEGTVTGFDVERERKKLMVENPKLTYTEALLKAKKIVQAKSGGVK